MNAYKCFRDLTKVSVYNILYIRTKYTVVGCQRVSIPTIEYRSARETGLIHGHKLSEVFPGLSTTDEIEDENNRLPLWGTNLYLQSVYSIMSGELASFNGETLASTLGHLDNCSLSNRECLTPFETLVWELVRNAPCAPLA
ncbi:unnamed protein product [Strongylus vulgaris]|uniref:Uncharacterized protein n=1 Tax=Strongylus vulgaris TaxID=40348 RepID=A0A3P7L414_STRVU|nr:unnamed protein product [Strongylus vulgaris]